MLQKRKWLLLTFYTTAGVMALERACTQAGLPGRIVPVPRSITADCGMAQQDGASRTPPPTRIMKLQQDGAPSTPRFAVLLVPP